MLTLTATAWDGAKTTLAGPVSLTLRKNEGMPCDELTAVFCCDIPLTELAEVALCYRDTELFSGIVDRQRQTVGAQGQSISLECRSRGALLLDNEATPRTHYYAKLSDIVRIHASDYGIKGVLGDDPYLSRYVVTKGFSVWRAISLFCRRTLGRTPRITDNGYIDTGGVTAEQKTRHISNRIDGAQRYVQIVSDTNRCEVLSTIKVQTQSGYYGMTVNNLDACGVRRTRLIVPSAEWANLPKQSAQELIRLSMRKKRQTTVVMPDIVPWGIGDEAVLCDEAFCGSPLCVSELEYRLDENGLFTTAVLLDRQYG